MTDTIFVTGASGHLGRAIVDHLLAKGVAASRIIAGTRNPDKLADLAAKGVTVRKADFDDPAGLEKAFAGAGTVLVISTDALDGAGTRLRQHKTAIAAAAKAGAKRIAYTSLPECPIPRRSASRRIISSRKRRSRRPACPTRSSATTGTPRTCS